MSYNVVATPNFDKELKRLARKYPSLKGEVNDLKEELKTNPLQGVDMGNNVRKIRLAVQSKGKGKRGGARVMTYLKMEKKNIILFSIYSKGKQDTITEQKIDEFINEINTESTNTGGGQ
jgi:mRNA-degrading endonuclease RelE of RelBE toxin-antitoxin system